MNNNSFPKSRRTSQETCQRNVGSTKLRLIGGGCTLGVRKKLHTRNRRYSDVTGLEKPKKALCISCATPKGAVRSNQRKSQTTTSYIHKQMVVETQPTTHKCAVVFQGPPRGGVRSRSPRRRRLKPALARTPYGRTTLQSISATSHCCRTC